MKYLIMCEGPNELQIVRLLLSNDCFIFSEDDLISLVPFHARQIKKSTVVQTALNMYPGKVIVLRIGDGLNERLTIPSRYKNQIVEVKKYCKKPELEMLLILAEQLDGEYQKVKSKIKPKTFAKEKIKYNRQKYDNSSLFYENYFKDRIDLLVDVIESYKKKHGSHKKDELYLADLLKTKKS